VLRWFQQSLSRWFVAPSSGTHFDCADGIRGLAILMVAVTHAFYYNENGPKIYGQIHKFIAMGWMGVPIFFALSAFLISLPFFRGRERAPRFWYHPGYALRRVAKILPPFYLVTAVMVVLICWSNHSLEPVKTGLAWATGIAHFVNYPPINGSFWSLWVEIGFYVTLPLLFLATRGLPVKTSGWIMFAVLETAPFVARLINWPNAAALKDWFFLTNRYPGYLEAFAGGVLFSAYYVSASREPQRWRRLAVLGYAGLAMLLVAGSVQAIRWQEDTPPQYVDMETTRQLTQISAFLLLFFVLDPQCLGSRFFASPVMRFIGIVSFEWFLIHQPMLFGFRRWFGSAQGSFSRYFAITLTPLAITFVAAVLIYHNFSLPILRWARERARATGERARVADQPRPLAPKA
jgi:peptidoglycan/LPS O-acetylase OafA/YrhL